VPECDIWFIKFSCDFHFNQLAIGNREGKVFVWEVQSSPPVLTARLTNPQCKSAIRQTAVSFDGSTILACSEDGSIWRWDEVDHPKA
jgi:polycomb protein EED